MGPPRRASIMNEATFESTLHAVLGRAFPSIANARITHQASMTLRLGRYSVAANGDLKKKAKGRLDVLVSVDSKPAVLLELKAPGRGVLTEDVEQARSYARLLNPMPPLFGVSDGQATRFFRTHDSSEWLAATIDDQQLQGLLDDALACAAAEHDSAVRLLLGRRPSLWAQILRAETQAALAALEGDVADFSRPLAASFSVPRAAVARLQASLHQSELVVLTGPPLSGKTNVLAQMCRSPDTNFVPLYIDAAAASYGIWRHLADVFSVGLLQATSAEETRQWVWSGLRDLSGPRPVLIIDGWRPGENDRVRADLEEIVGRLAAGNLRIVLALDDADFESLSHVPGRTTKTPLGRAAKQIPLGILEDAEFEQGIGVLYEKQGASFYAGAHHNRELRFPRLLRLHAALTGGHDDAPTDTAPPGPSMSMATLLPAITSVDIVEAAWRQFTSGPNQELRSDLELLATAWVTIPSPTSPQELMAFEQLGRSALPMQALEHALTAERLRRLRQQGFLRPVEIPGGHFMIMRLPELLAAAAAAVVAKRVIAEPNVDAAYDLFLRETQRFPLSDVVGAGVILRSYESVRIVDGLMKRLLDDEPIVTHLTGGRAELITGEGSRPSAVEDGRTMSNLHPALVLSHLAAVPMAFDDENDRRIDGGSPNATIIGRVGGVPHLLRRIDTVPVREMRPISFHYFGDVSVVCHNEGIVEPIVQSILFHLLREPEEAGELAKWAVEEDRAPLVWRLRIAASLASTVTDPELAEQANIIDRLCLRYWRRRFDAMAH